MQKKRYAADVFYIDSNGDRQDLGWIVILNEGVSVKDARKVAEEVEKTQKEAAAARGDSKVSPGPMSYALRHELKKIGDIYYPDLITVKGEHRS